MNDVLTIGYQGRSVDDLVAQLIAARVRRVVDVRALPLSRRKGFSKTPLRQALESHGIEYVHIKAAGNPFRSHDASAQAILNEYRRHLSSCPAVVDEVAQAVLEMRSALLCMERQPHECHRSVIADAVAASKHLAIKHL